MQADELSLATRAAWLSYVGNQTQEEIAGRLGVSRVKVNRLIGQAVRAGMVRVFVEGAAVECIALEEAIAARWGLEFCAVAPTVDASPLPLAALAAAGGHWLHRALEAGRASLIGVGHGRTLAAVATNLPRIPRPNVRFVSLLGSLTRHAAANPFDVIHRLTEITGAESYFMPAPFFADSVEDKAVLLGQRSLEAVFALARTAELMVVGIGEVGADSHLLTSGMITPEEFGEVERAGAEQVRGLAEGDEAGGLLGGDGEPGAAEVELAAEAVGDQVGHHAEDRGGAQRREEAVGGAGGRCQRGREGFN